MRRGHILLAYRRARQQTTRLADIGHHGKPVLRAENIGPQSQFRVPVSRAIVPWHLGLQPVEQTTAEIFRPANELFPFVGSGRDEVTALEVVPRPVDHGQIAGHLVGLEAGRRQNPAIGPERPREILHSFEDLVGEVPRPIGVGQREGLLIAHLLVAVGPGDRVILSRTDVDDEWHRPGLCQMRRRSVRSGIRLPRLFP